MIWPLIVAAGRVVRVSIKWMGDTWILFGSPPPVTLHINRQSRFETFRSYQVAFGTDLIPTRVLFNYDYDTLYLQTHMLSLRFLNRRDRAKVKWLSIPEYVPIGPHSRLAGSWPQRFHDTHLLQCPGFFMSLMRLSTPHTILWNSSCLLTRFYPALRKISVRTFDTCNKNPCDNCNRCKNYLRSYQKPLILGHNRKVRIPLLGYLEGESVEVTFNYRRLHYSTLNTIINKDHARLAITLHWALSSNELLFSPIY